MASSSLVELPATELRRLIGIKAISPVELLEACIARIEALDPAVNAIAARAFERARTEARAAEAAVLRGEARMLFAAQLGVDSRDPLSHALDPGSAAHARLADLGRLRVAWTTDFGCCPSARRFAR